MPLYQIQAKIGDGGCGNVYSAIRMGDCQPVAIKKIPRDKVAQWQIIENHLVPLEVALMMRYKVCLTIVMDRPRNSMDLFDLIAERGKLDERQASKIFKQVSVIRLIFD